MTSTAWGQGIANALICGLGWLAALGLIGGAVAWLTGRPFQAVVGLTFLVLLTLVMVTFFASLVRDLAQRGRLVLDCGRHPMWWLFLLNAALFLMMGWAMLPAGRGPIVLAKAWPVLGVVFVAFWVVLATGRLQVRENGLWQYWALLRWERLASYHWADDATLILRGRGLLQFLQGALPVPPEHQAEVKALLAKHAPADLGD
jgi:hypothetical protein